LEASSFNIDLSSWEVGQVTTMENMFEAATSFNSDLSGWQVNQVTTMEYMFGDATSFNSDLSAWQVGQVTNMAFVFRNAHSFTSDLSSWELGQVTTMYGMFLVASSFNSDLSSWEVGRVTNMHDMFSEASSFSSDLSSWEVGQVTTMENMFVGSAMAIDLRAPIGPWDVSSINTDGMYTGSCLVDTSRCEATCPSFQSTFPTTPPGYHIADPSGTTVSGLGVWWCSSLGFVPVIACDGTTFSVAGCHPPPPCYQYECGLTVQRVNVTVAATLGSSAEACCEDITGRCSGNTDSTADVDCSATYQQLIASSAFTDGSTAEVCCEDITGRCYGNTDLTASFDCSATSQQPIVASVFTIGSDAATCCEAMEGVTQVSLRTWLLYRFRMGVAAAIPTRAPILTALQLSTSSSRPPSQSGARPICVARTTGCCKGCQYRATLC
jgi:surface protein